jgi:hypothetical protein
MLIRSAVLQEEHQDQYLTRESYFISQAEVNEVINFTDLELFVRDSETGRSISKAMIGIDAIARTAVGDDRGNVFIDNILEGTYTVDIIVPGYIACSKQIYLSSNQLNRMLIMMIRNC